MGRRGSSSCSDAGFVGYIAEPLIDNVSDELHDALIDLAEALNRVDQPVRDAVEELTTRDVRVALAGMPVRARGHALEPLGIHLAPKTLSQGLCRDVLGRLQRAEEPTARHAGLHLTNGSVYDGVRQSAFADPPNRDDAEAHHRLTEDVESRWSPALLRLTLWSGVTQNEYTARMWAWATDRPWFLHGAVDTDAAARVRAAALAVIDLSPELDDAMHARHSSEPVVDDARLVLSPETSDRVIDNDRRAVTPRGQRGPVSSDPQAALTVAQVAFATAVTAAESVLIDLRAGLPPTDDDLDTMRMAQHSYSTACAALPDLAADARPTLEQITATLAAQAIRNADAPLHGSIAGALGITSSDAGMAQHIEQLYEITGELRATEIWSDAQRAMALAIAALVDLVRQPEADAERRLDLQTQISTAATTAPALAVLGMLATQLSLPATTATSADDSDAAPDAVAEASANTTADTSAMPVDGTTGSPAMPFAEPASSVTAADTDPATDPTQPSSPDRAQTDPQGSNGASPASSTPSDAGPVGAPSATQAAGPPFTSALPEHPARSSPRVTRAANTPVPDSPPVAAAHDTAPAATTGEAAVERTVATLVAASRYGLASHIARRASWSDTRIRTFRLAGLACAVRTETGPCGALLRTELSDLDSSELAEDSASLLIATVSLVRVALVTGEPAAGAQLGELGNRLDPHLASIADEVGRRALRGVLSATPALTVLADVSDAERELKETLDQAGNARRTRTLRFKRCSDIAKRWLDSNGLLGRVLDIVINNDPTRFVEAQTEVQHLSDASYRERAIDEVDAHFRGHGGKPIEGAGRQDLHALILETLRPVRSWIGLTTALNRSKDSHDEWTTGEVADMRTAVLAERGAALAALQAQTKCSEPLLAAAARGAHVSLERTFALLDGAEALQAGEPRVTVALDLELLKADDVVVNDAGTLDLNTAHDLPALLAAAERTWAQGFDQHLERENYPAAKYLLTLQQNADLPGDALPDNARNRYAAAMDCSRSELTAAYSSVDTDLRRARRSNVVTEETDVDLIARLAAANPERDDNLGRVRATLREIASKLPEYREQAAERLRQRLAALDIDEEERARITAPINADDLLTAEELLYFQEIGEPVPRTDHSRTDLADFYPAVPNALRDGITAQMLAAVRERTKYAGSDVLNFSGLSPDAAEQIGTALGAWRQLATTPVASRRNINERDLLLPAMRLIGYNCSRIRRLDELSKGPERRFIEITDVQPNSTALIPAFGSKVGGRLRVLLVWGQPAEDLLLSYAEHDQSGDTLVIAHFGTMSAVARAKFAARVERTGSPVAVLDDAALAYLAARGNRQLGVTMSVLMPFAAVNPYIRMKRGAVAEEMFYGRDLERKQVIDPDGTQVLYGGRGLGKSALLRYAADWFESSGEPGQRIAVYLSLDSVAAGAAFSKDALWVGLRNALTDRGVLAAPTGKAAKAAGDVYEQVRAGMIAWRNQDTRNRLLILLDESDAFFEADAPEFVDTKRLRDIGVVTDNNIKVVFAGLHSVQRYAKSARNGPFSHLAQRPTVIGPLRPQFAADLLTVPLNAMGYQFADDNLVNRVLGYCSYQPFLLQMFGHRLVEAMHAQRRDGLRAGQPPYIITDEDVAAVERNADLRADITSAFQDTLNLDPRYNVVANVLADHALRFGFDARLQDVALREECLSWWREGFESLDSESFRAYLNEMDGLGVVAPNNDGRGWRLRSPNVLNMIGTRADVERQLLQAAYESVPDMFLALESRATLPDGSTAPLTAAQLDDILGDHSTHTRVVIGSRATGLDQVTATLRHITSQAGDFDIPPITSRRMFEEELTAGKPGRRRVIIDDLATLKPQPAACLEALDVAQYQVPSAPGLTRAAVIVSSPDQGELWTQALQRGVAVALRRYDRRSLRVWSINRQHFQNEERQQRLWQLTGGWPMLVEQAAKLAERDGAQELAALGELAAYVNGRAGHAELLEAVGIYDDPDLARAYASVVALVDDQHVSLADLHVAADMDARSAEIVDRLIAAQVFETDDDGAYSLEWRLMTAWKAGHSEFVGG